MFDARQLRGRVENSGQGAVSNQLLSGHAEVESVLVLVADRSLFIGGRAKPRHDGGGGYGKNCQYREGLFVYAVIHGIRFSSPNAKMCY